MKREEVKELIKQYKDDGFPKLDICLKNNDIGVSNDDNIVFSENFLTISNSNYLFHIRYSAVEGICV